MWFGVSSSTAEEIRLKGFSEVAEILNDFLKITELLGCSAWAKVSCSLWMMRWLSCFLQADWVLDCPLWVTVWLNCFLWVNWILNCLLWTTEWLNCFIWVDWILNVFFRDRAGLGKISFVLIKFFWFWNF